MTTDSKNVKPLYKKEHEQNGFSSKKPAQNHHAAFAVCGNWGIFRSSSCGRFYYHNSANGASQWEKPRDWNIKPDIDELIAQYGNGGAGGGGGGASGGGGGGGGGGNSSHREHPSSSVSSQRPSSSSVPPRQNLPPSSSAKRPQYLTQSSSRTAESPHSSSASSVHHQDNNARSSASSRSHPHNSHNSSSQMVNDYHSSSDAKRRKQDGASPGGTPHSSGSGGSGNTSSTQKVLSQISEVLIQQVRDKLDVIKDKLHTHHGRPSDTSGSHSVSAERHANQKSNHGLSPSSDVVQSSHRPSATNTRPGSPSKTADRDESAVSSLASSDSSSSLAQNRFLADEPFSSLLLRCDRAIASLDSLPPPQPQLYELLASANDEMAVKLEKQARRVREETVSKYDTVLQVALGAKAQRSLVRKIDIMTEINAKRVATIQKQIEELVASRKELAALLRQPSHMQPFPGSSSTPIGISSSSFAPSSHGHR